MQFFFSLFRIALVAIALPLFAVRIEPQPVVVLGGGIGGLTSAIYLARAGLHPIVIEGKLPGGLLTQSHAVQNWPGELEIGGMELTEKIRKQAKANGALLLNEEVVGIDFSSRPLIITTRALDAKGTLRKIEATSCIIAMGTEPNFLGVPGESLYWGHGVSNCAVCDGTLYRDRIVGVVGGGDAAVLEALYLADLAKEVHVFVRKGSFKAVEKKRLQALQSRANVKVYYHTTVEEIKGEGDLLTEVTLNTGGKTYDFSLDGLFLAIGSRPNTQLFQNVLKLDEKGYIVLKKGQETSLKGVFAMGDVADPVYKQAISAAGDGAKAALQAKEYVSDRAGSLTSNEVVEISSVEQFEQELKAGNLPILVDFYAIWCGPCRRIFPLFEHSAQGLSGKIRFLRVNVDTLRDLSHRYNIQAMPTVLFFDPSGNIVERKVGSEQITSFLEHLEPNIAEAFEVEHPFL